MEKFSEIEKKLPVFVKIEEYQEVIDVAELISKKLRDAKALLAAIEDIKAREEAQLEEWRGILDEIERKISEIDKMLLEPREF